MMFVYGVGAVAIMFGAGFFFGHWLESAVAIMFGAGFFFVHWLESAVLDFIRAETRDIREVLRTFKGSLNHLEGRVTKLEKAD